MEIFVLRGVPGSGKSRFASSIALAMVLSADSYFMHDGVYKFDPSKLGDAHAACLREYAEHIRKGYAGIVVVDNTNTTNVEVAPYLALAQAYGHKVRIVHVACEPLVAWERNTHGVPGQTVERMHSVLATELARVPPFWPRTETMT